MTATETRPETAGGHVDRSDVLRSAAAIVAGGVALTSQNGILAQAGEQARAVDERFFPGFKTEKVATRFSVFGHDRGVRVSDKQMPGGHSFQESHPKETAAELRSFLAA